MLRAAGIRGATSVELQAGAKPPTRSALRRAIAAPQFPLRVDTRRPLSPEAVVPRPGRVAAGSNRLIRCPNVRFYEDSTVKLPHHGGI